MISSNWTRENLAWLAGLLEGEGSFILQNGRTPVVQVSMTDEDVVLRAQKVAGMGGVSGPYDYGVGKKPQWVFKVANQPHAYALMAALYPWMASRRQQAIRTAISGWLVWCEQRPAQIRRGAETRRKVTQEMRDRVLSEYNGKRWSPGQAHALCMELGVSMKTLYNISRGRQ